MKPIYKPSGKAKEYGDYAINIYTGCTHRCSYCFAPSVLRKTREDFHSNVEPRKNIVNEVKKQIEREKLKGKLIHLCFTCDPYPADIDTTATREIIKLIKDSGNHVQILTKGGTISERDFDLLDENDWFGVTYTGYGGGKLCLPCEQEPFAAIPANRLAVLDRAHDHGIRTWMSMEPVLNEKDIYLMLRLNLGYVDKFKIGKLNYHPSEINWGEFGKECERLCKENELNYYIKEGLRAEMNKS